jgi:hypothetical protein
MGYCPFYQAVPESSTLLARLRGDRKLATMMIRLFSYGSCPFDLDEIEDELDDHLDRMTEDCPDVFGSRAEAEATLEDLRRELASAEASYPGLVARTAFLNKSQHEIEERLVRALDERGVAEPSERVKALLWGVESFGPPGANFGQWGYVPSALVKEGAALLRDLDLKAIITEDEDAYDWLEEDYPPWRDLYLQAAALGEAILVY